MSNHGGKRPGAGRKPGVRNRRTLAATELVQEAQEQFPGYNPLTALIALANATDDDDLARQCHTAILPYMAPKFRPIEADPDALVELEGRIARTRLAASVELAREDPVLAALADRLARARERREQSFILMASDPLPVIEPEPAPEPEQDSSSEFSAEGEGAGQAVEPPVQPAPAAPKPPPPPAPILPWPDAPATAEQDYDPWNFD